MKIALISINKYGEIIADKIKNKLSIDVFRKDKNKKFNIKELSRKLMMEYDAVIFVSSTGIAVRSIAEFIKDKTKDPAVIVIDILGKYVISLLSGHIGRANELSLKIADILSAEPIITTATDNLKIEAPDIIASKNGFIIDNMELEKEMAALLVEGKKVAFIDEDKIIKTPKGYSENTENIHGIIYITNKLNVHSNKFNLKELKFIRKNIVLGIGCRKNYNVEKMQSTVLKKLEDFNIDKRAVKKIVSIDLKKDETAIKELCKSLKAEFITYSTYDIKKVEDEFSGSAFVYKTIGVKSVCEPCVMLSKAKIIAHKMKLDGMTLCIGKLLECGDLSDT
ncbi:MAG: cobalt-precorrin 5A hydrolase [Clostridium sp.]|nr:cobalt-precorrin 5A hydrolase [Clostridium sp.]